MPVSAKSSNCLSVDKLNELISYDAESGELRWKVNRLSFGGKARSGSLAGTIDKSGYLIIVIKGLVYPAHRLAWYLYNCRWPTLQIDHINMDPLDNRICNLREATMTEQRANQRVRRDSISGVKGVRLPPKGRWIARIRSNGKGAHLGTFDTAEEASAAYSNAAMAVFNEFARSV